MAIFTDIDGRVEAVRAAVGVDCAAAEVPGVVAALGGEAALSILQDSSAAIRVLQVLQSAAAGVVAGLSKPEAGHSGFAQTRGHRSPVSLVQEITGSTRADAVKRVRLGESLLADVHAGTADGQPTAAGGVPVAPAVVLWHAPIRAALLSGTITTDQHDAIRRGLGEPPEPVGDETADGDTLTVGADLSGVDLLAGMRAMICEAWSAAAGQLVDEASQRSVEELRVVAHAIRDRLDPAGAAARYDQRYLARSFRMWTDADGTHRAAVSFDDEMAAWVTTITASALRARRGGPRFVDPDETARAQELLDDPRSGDQLTYDLIFETLRIGALADAATVFGTRQAGIRIVTITDPITGAGALLEDTGTGTPMVAHLEDTGATLPGWIAEQHACATGSIPCLTDRTGNPLYLGREQRLFSPTQKLALALRDGGCRWTGCDRPASYCESHHIDHYATDNGRTDIDRGILLCRFHHMNLHHHGWHITRHALDTFRLHPPGEAAPIVLTRRLHLQYAWANIPPPTPTTQTRRVTARKWGTGSGLGQLGDASWLLISGPWWGADPGSESRRTWACGE